MAGMVTTTGFSSLQEKLGKLAMKARADDGTMVETGYTAPYAVYVHEDLEAEHPNGQAKYLEGPSRLYAREVQREILRVIRQGGTWEEALLAGGRYLLERSQEVVPVDTGVLKASGFVGVVQEKVS